ncbi:MAG: DUF3127 domain-containing protein [Paludibacteraceae bacterium]|nr:DUF3127 domain-containing protein [Paludibacteraceae bacterium]
MEVSGKIIQVLPLQSGISKTSGNPWQLQAYVLETQEQYPRKVHFEIFGEDRIKNNACEMDELVTVSFDIESREFNGRWYTSIRAWKVQKGIVGEATAATATPAAAQEVHNTVAAAPNVTPFDAMPSNDDSGDLPF